MKENKEILASGLFLQAFGCLKNRKAGVEKLGESRCIFKIFIDMEQKRMSELDITELDQHLIINLDGGHHEVSMDRESVIMFSEFIGDFFMGVLIKGIIKH